MIAIRGDLLDFTGTPGGEPHAPSGVRWRPDHWLLIDRGRIVGVRPPQQPPGPDWSCIDHRGRLVLPGFIDTHVHSPQIEVIGSWGTTLLDWLETHTFPAERGHADPALAEAAAQRFVAALLAHGSTSAVVFPTVHRGSAEALFEAAHARGMRMVAGKVLMDRHAPADLCDDVVQAEADCRALIGRWHGRGRLAYAVTVRFAITSSDEQLAMAGRLCRDHPGVYLQTHVAENGDEVRRVAELFPQSRSYLGVYHRHGLLHPRSVLAHGIWLDDADRSLLRDSGAQIAFCPSSNLFLGSGLFDWPAARRIGHRVSIGSDVGGGTSLSMLRTLADGYKVQALRGWHPDAWTLLHAATLGAAEALGLAGEIGRLEPGTAADVVVWDWACGPVAAERDAAASAAGDAASLRRLHERLFAWITLGDERNVVQTFVAGRPCLGGPAFPGPRTPTEPRG